MRSAKAALVLLSLIAPYAMRPQTEVPAGSEPVPTFGTTVVIPGGLHGQIYLLLENTKKLPEFEKMKPVGSIYTSYLDIPLRSWLLGFPGVTDRFEWFAIDYRGKFWIGSEGMYRFALMSDDGSRLWIDHQLIIDNDGVHLVATRLASIRLSRDVHTIRVSYFQGPRDKLALVLFIAAPGERFHLFSTDELKPPANPEDWHPTPQVPGANDGSEPDPGPLNSTALNGTEPNFPITSMAGAGLTASFFHIPKETGGLRFIKQMQTAGSFSTETVSLPSENIYKQSLGRSGESKSFLLTFAGNFWVSQPGLYQFALTGEDGAILSVDGQLIDDNDQPHDDPAITRYASLNLCRGAHHLQVGMFHVSSIKLLKLEIALPGEAFRLFDTRDFAPPPNAESSAGSCPVQTPRTQ